jgi:hypothetical protein
MLMKTCGERHKHRYTTKRQAINVAIKRSFRSGTPLRVYFHKECGAYHLTSQPKFDRASVDMNSRGAVA